MLNFKAKTHEKLVISYTKKSLEFKFVEVYVALWRKVFVNYLELLQNVAYITLKSVL